MHSLFACCPCTSEHARLRRVAVNARRLLYVDHVPTDGHGCLLLNGDFGRFVGSYQWGDTPPIVRRGQLNTDFLRTAMGKSCKFSAAGPLFLGITSVGRPLSLRAFLVVLSAGRRLFTVAGLGRHHRNGGNAGFLPMPDFLSCGFSGLASGLVDANSGKARGDGWRSFGFDRGG